jgi:peptide/nickel transport system substrate-binding protein
VLVINANHPLLKDKRVRQALSLAIDRDTLVKALWAGQAFVPNGHQMADFGDMYNPDRKPPQYDPEKAKALLKAAGYKGEEIVLRTMSSYYINALAASQIIQQMWKKVGVNMKLEIVENFTQTRTPDVMIYPWSNSFRLPDPMGGIWPLYGDASAIQKKYKYWTAPAEFNRLGNVVESSMDPKERYQAFQGMLDIFEDDVPAILLYNAFETYAMKRDIDWTPYPLFFMDFRPDVFKMSEAAKRP